MDNQKVIGRAERKGLLLNIGQLRATLRNNNVDQEMRGDIKRHIKKIEGALKRGTLTEWTI